MTKKGAIGIEYSHYIKHSLGRQEVNMNWFSRGKKMPEVSNNNDDDATDCNEKHIEYAYSLIDLA